MGIKRVKSPFTFIEIGISCILTPTLLLSYIHLIVRVLTTTGELERLHLEIHNKVLMQERISSLLDHAQPHSLQLSQGTLSFIATDLLDADPEYSGTLPVTLAPSKKGLTLTVKERPELLYPHIKEATWKVLSHSLILSITPSTQTPPFQCAFPLEPTMNL